MRNYVSPIAQAGLTYAQNRRLVVTAQDHLRLPPVDLGLHTRVSDQRHERLDLAKPPARRGDMPIDLPLRDLRSVLLDQPQIRRAVWRCLRGTCASARNQSSITVRYAPSFGAGRLLGALFGGGTGSARACRTARR
jgi:hypothetical protein